jgi:hypothetical protein
MALMKSRQLTSSVENRYIGGSLDKILVTETIIEEAAISAF